MRELLGPKFFRHNYVKLLNEWVLNLNIIVNMTFVFGVRKT